VIRVAAVGDVHVGVECGGRLKPCFDELHQHADLLLLAGDLTRHGSPDEAKVLARELADMRVPVVAVLGNHDHHQDENEEITRILVGVGVHVLDGTATVLDVDGVSIGVGGIKGFGGGFPGASGSDFGEPEMKAFMRHSREVACRLQDALSVLTTDVRIALTHYSPVEDTLRGERLEIYPFLGCWLLAEAIDAAGADAAFHGHAHRGAERGMTPGGVRVRNVAEPVLGHPYRVYGVEPRAGQWAPGVTVADLEADAGAVAGAEAGAPGLLSVT
jgi:Icc-related predicted phosphoesterase